MTFAFSSHTFAFVSTAQSREQPSRHLSLSIIERLLALPKGSARKRRLIVLAVGTDHVPGTELQRGDRLVVEPGTRTNGGYLLACRSRSGIVLRRLRFPPHGEPVLAAPDEDLLPLEDQTPCTVLGTILAAIRTSGGGDACVAFAPRYEFGGSHEIWTPSLYPSNVRSTSIATAIRRSNSSILRSFLGRLARPTRNAQLARQLDAATTRLTTLGKCLDAVDDERIYGALVREINVTVLRLRRAFAITDNWVPLAYEARTAKRHPREGFLSASAKHAADRRQAGHAAALHPRSNAQRQIFRG